MLVGPLTAVPWLVAAGAFLLAVWPRRSVWSRERIVATIIEGSLERGLEPAVPLAFAKAETNFQNLVGDNGRSFGPFQLQAQFHIPAGVDPLDPGATIPLALDLIQRLLERADGDVLQARILYVCGSPGGCSQAKRELIATRLDNALQDVSNTMAVV